MKSPVIFIFLNKSLGMSSGKLAAQAAHAAAMVIAGSKPTEWYGPPARTVITLEARDETHLRNIRDYLTQRNIKSHIIIDEGMNEIEAHTPTALGTEILDKEDPKTTDTFISFKKYRDIIRATIEIDRD